MFVHEFAKQLSRDLAITPPLVSDDEGRYKLAMDGKLLVEMRPHESGFVLSTDLGTCPDTIDPKIEREEFFRTLLLANLLGQGTGRSMLGLDSTGQRIHLILALPYEVPYLEGRDLLEEFLNYAEYWTEEIENRSRRGSSE